MNKEEYFKKYGDIILSHEFRKLKLDKELLQNGLKLYKSEKKLCVAFRNYRRQKSGKEVVKQDVDLTPNSITIQKRFVKKTKAKIDVSQIIDNIENNQCEVIAESEIITTENATISKMTFHSDLTAELYPTVNKLIKESREYLNQLQTEHLQDIEDVKADNQIAIREWKNTIKPFKSAFAFFNTQLMEAIELFQPTNSTMVYNNISNIIDNLCKLTDKIAKIENTLIYKLSSKYDIRDKQTKEITSFIDGLVKMQMTIKGMIDNDINLLQNGYVKKEVDNKIEIPNAIVELYQNTSN